MNCWKGACIYISASSLFTRRMWPASTLLSRTYVKRKKKKKWSDEWEDVLFEHLEAKKQQPLQEPSLLHVVYRVKELKGRPYWEKDAMKSLHLDGPLNKPVIHKNTPSMNDRLSKVKHLIKIRPITFPYGLPKDESDLQHCTLRENGEFIVLKKIDEQCIEDVRIIDEVPEKVWDLDKDTLQNEAMKKKLNYELLNEYFKPAYRYKFNQDGKEHRYFGDRNICSDRDWY